MNVVVWWGSGYLQVRYRAGCSEVYGIQKWKPETLEHSLDLFKLGPMKAGLIFFSILHDLAPESHSQFRLIANFEQCSSHPNSFCLLLLSLMEALSYQLFQLGSLQSWLVVLMTRKTSMLLNRWHHGTLRLRLTDKMFPCNLNSRRQRPLEKLLLGHLTYARCNPSCRGRWAMAELQHYDPKPTMVDLASRRRFRKLAGQDSALLNEAALRAALKNEKLQRRIGTNNTTGLSGTLNKSTLNSLKRTFQQKL